MDALFLNLLFMRNSCPLYEAWRVEDISLLNGSVPVEAGAPRQRYIAFVNCGFGHGFAGR
jgi:hypothetical protein